MQLFFFFFFVLLYVSTIPIIWEANLDLLG